MQQCLPLLHYSQPPVTWNLLTTIYSQKKKRNPSDGFTSNICKSYATHACWLIFKSCCGKQPIVKVLQVSQEMSQTLGGSFESKFIYRSLLKAILLHLSLDLIQCRTRSVLLRYVDATSSNCSATVMVDSIA